MWTKDNIAGQAGKTVIVTGANTGIGFETARALYQAGAQVILACRSLENAEQALARIAGPTGKGSLETGILDLSNLASVKEFADTFKKKHDQLHVLINNAGVMYTPEKKTAEGFELQFGVNFIGHFALTGYLYPLLRTTPGSRVVTVSSMAYLAGKIDFENLRSELSYDARREYSRSKLANILFTRELHRRIVAAGDPVTSIAAQPGANKTDLARHMSGEEYAAALARVGTLMEPWQGALPSLYAAVSDEAEGGELYSPDQDGGYRGYPARVDIMPHGLDEAVAARLWQLAEEAAGVYYP